MVISSFPASTLASLSASQFFTNSSVSALSNARFSSLALRSPTPSTTIGVLPFDGAIAGTDNIGWAARLHVCRKEDGGWGGSKRMGRHDLVCNWTESIDVLGIRPTQTKIPFVQSRIQWYVYCRAVPLHLGDDEPNTETAGFTGYFRTPC